MNLPIEGEPLPRGDESGAESKGPRRFGDLQKTITMAQIAKAAGVSQGAISSLLNDRDYGIRVSEKTRERVFKVCREMGYIPNDLRAVVRMYPEMGDFCLLISTRWSAGLSAPDVARVASVVLSHTDPRPGSLALGYYDAKADYSGEVSTLPHPLITGVSSKYLIFGEPNVSLYQVILRRGCPVVSLGADVAMAGVLSLLADYEQASRVAIAHLYELGHRQLGIVSGPFGATESKLIGLNHGVRMACEEFGIALDAQNIVYGDLSFQAGMAAFQTFGNRLTAPTALFCMSDAAAAGVLAAAQMSGCEVPAQLSVMGCDDERVGEMTSPALSTVHIPLEEMAAAGVRNVESLVNEGALGQPRREVFPVWLVERQSCAALGDR